MEEHEKLNGKFTEISRDYYIQLLENVPPERFSNPYRDGGWFIVGEAYTHDRKLHAWHHLCFQCDGRYYWALRHVKIHEDEIIRQISEFLKSIDK